MTEKPPRQLPTGIGGEKLQEGRETLPAVEVKNEVIWVSKDVELPFDIQKGESNRLGMFFIPPSKLTESDSPFPLEIRAGHHRTGILGRVIFKDKEGNLYRDIDVNGIGYTWFNKVEELKIEPPTKKEPSDRSWGIMNESYAENDVKKAEQFLKAGIRTYRPLAIIKLDEVVDKNGVKVSLNDARKRKMILKNYDPVVEVRAFGTVARIQDAITAHGDLREKFIKDAKWLVAQEVGKNPDDFTGEEYVMWFTESVAKSLARMHAKNWLHGYLTFHNITLDARIVDLDSVMTVQEVNARKESGEISAKSFLQDQTFAEDTIYGLSELVSSLSRDSINKIFGKVYEEELKKLRTKNKPKK